MPSEPLSEEMKEALAKFECLSYAEEFKDHITNLFYLTSQEISKNARTLTDKNNPYVRYRDTDLVFRSQFVELRDQIVRYTNNELIKVNGDGKAVPKVDYVILWSETAPENWENDYESYYILKANGKYEHVPHSDPAPVYEPEKYYRKETS